MNWKLLAKCMGQSFGVTAIVAAIVLPVVALAAYAKNISAELGIAAVFVGVALCVGIIFYLLQRYGPPPE